MSDSVLYGVVRIGFIGCACGHADVGVSGFRAKDVSPYSLSQIVPGPKNESITDETKVVIIIKRSSLIRPGTI